MKKFILSILINVLKYLVWLMRSWKILGNGISLPVKNGFAIQTMSWKNFKNIFLNFISPQDGIISPLIQILCRFNNHKESRKLFVKIFIQKCVISRFLFSWYDAFYFYQSSVLWFRKNNFCLFWKLFKRFFAQFRIWNDGINIRDIVEGIEIKFIEFTMVS